MTEKIYQQYYTKSNEIISYMLNKLAVRENSIILEPCAGDGVFVDALLQKGNNIKVEAFELDISEANKLKNKYNSKDNVSIVNEDTLLYNDFISNMKKNKYDFVIANPPYGAWQDYNKRDILKKIYPNLYIKETYTTFLYLCISLLKEGGRLVFITPDTYLNLHMHTFLRKYILQNTLIEEISIFTSSFFPGVNFGYSKLAIITLEKHTNIIANTNNKIKIIDQFKTPADLINGDNARIIYINQSDVIQNKNHAFIYSDDNYLNELLKFSAIHVGDIAHCVTGIYTGDDKKFIKVKDHSVKNSKNYEIITGKEIYTTATPNLNGYYKELFVPIIKGGNTRYLKSDFWYVNWSKESVLFYKTNKKSRFQNSQFYFKQGLAVPMVSSKSITASLINNRLIDQSIVGVFPKNDEHILYLLAFFNTSICTKLLRSINPSANNSANYIKKIPLVIPDNNTIVHINSLVEMILSLKKAGEDYSSIENELDNIFNVIFYENIDRNTRVNLQNELF